MNDAPSAHRMSLREGRSGFTLIELLVVVTIIGILAAIAIPVYLGIQRSARDSVAKSDLADAKIAVVGYETDNRALPGSIDGATLRRYGYSSTSVDWSASPPPAASTAFCLVATSSTGNRFYATDLLGVGAANAVPLALELFGVPPTGGAKSDKSPSFGGVSIPCTVNNITTGG